jgi:ATP phosphoribosyltransferase regulatory subunit
MLHLIDVRDSAGLRSFLASFTASEADCAAFSRLTQLTGRREIIDRARRIITNERSLAALGGLENLWRVIEEMGLTDSFEIDLGDVSGLDYYTGLTFKVYVAGAGTRIGSGGRYDCLTANFGSAEPAVGFVLDLDAMSDVLMRKNRSAAIEANPARASRLTDHDLAALFLAAREKRLNDERVILESEVADEG